MARQLQVQGYTIYACDRCGFAYKEALTAEECALFDLERGMRSADITGKCIAPPNRYWQAVTRFLEEEQKAAKAKAAAAAKAAAGGAPAAPAAPGAAPAAGAPAAAKPAPPKLTPEELEARKKAALEKAAAMKAQTEAQAQG